MKKSKVIIPALGVLILSTAASVTGTVAWFTANRTATITAGEFAVVKTNDDLTVTLFAGVGTTVDNAAHSVSVVSGNKLTDSSFDHTSYNGTDTQDNTPANAVLPIVIPNTPRSHVLNNVALASVNTTNLLRGTNTYSAFTWDMQFTVSFSESANKNLGLYIDLSDAASYMKETKKPGDHFTNEADGDWFSDLACTTPVTPSAANYYAYVATGSEAVAGWYTNAGCDVSATGTYLTAGTTYYKPGLPCDGSTTLYKVEPNHTGKAFRIAFVPTTATNAASTGYTKIWAENETGTATFVDGISAGNAAANELNAVAYDTATTKWVNGAYSAETAGSGKVLMDRTDTNEAIPADGDLAKAAALSTKSNYLGFFGVQAGTNVSITYRCVAWFDGTHPEIIGSATDFETIIASMRFGVSELTD